MTILLVIFVVLAIASVPLTKFAVSSNYDVDDAPWYAKLFLYPLSYALWGYLLFPVWAAIVWAETFQSKAPPFDTNLRLKGLVIGVCWMFVVCQLFYRMGFRAGAKSAQ